MFKYYERKGLVKNKIIVVFLKLYEIFYWKWKEEFGMFIFFIRKEGKFLWKKKYYGL